VFAFCTAGFVELTLVCPRIASNDPGCETEKAFFDAEMFAPLACLDCADPSAAIPAADVGDLETGDLETGDCETGALVPPMLALVKPEDCDIAATPALDGPEYPPPPELMLGPEPLDDGPALVAPRASLPLCLRPRPFIVHT
jgi:hypothetical protein